MNESARKLTYTYAEYLAQEEASESKHEFVNGEIYAMAGGTPEHAAICTNVLVELRAALRGRPCQVYTSDLRIRVLATGIATYPDVSVVCGSLERDPTDKNAVTNPLVLVEVLLDSTEAYDRGEKFAHYRRIPSLREYVLVSQNTRRIEVYRRNADDTWTLYEAVEQGRIQLVSVDAVLELEEVYRSGLAG